MLFVHRLPGPLWIRRTLWQSAPMTAPQLTMREDTRRRALDTTMRALDVKDAHLAVRLGISRSAAQSWRSGGVRLREDQVEAAAEALGVPVALMDLAPDDVLRWLADNRRDEVFASSGWFGGNPGGGEQVREFALTG